MLPRKIEYDDRKLREAKEKGMPCYDLTGKGDTEDLYSSCNDTGFVGEDLYSLYNNTRSMGKDLSSSCNDAGFVGEVLPSLQGVMDDFRSADEIDSGEMMFHAPYLHNLGGNLGMNLDDL